MKNLIGYVPLFIATLLAGIVLSSCGGGGGAAPPVITSLQAFYVNATTGLDTNVGTAAAPFKTLTKAINAASAVGAVNIYAASGVYDAANGETFPLMVANGENMIGAGSAVINGSGNYVTVGSAVVTTTSSVVFASGVSGSLTGFSLTAAANSQVVADNAPAVIIANNRLSGSAYEGVLVVNGGRTTLTSNVIDSSVVAVDVSGTTTELIARGNTLNQIAGTHGVITGNRSRLGANLDLGTSASPGNNVILGSGIGLYSLADLGAPIINASGNTWKPNVQSADAAGHYAAVLITGPTTAVLGTNYSLFNANAIQY